MPSLGEPQSNYSQKYEYAYLYIPVYSYRLYMSFLCGSAGKESACNAEDLDSIPGLKRSPVEGKGYPLQYSGLENSRDCIVHGVAESDMTEWLSLSLYSYRYLDIDIDI